MNGKLATADIIIVGAGMAGASLAAEIGDGARVVLLEAESQPGYHSTGRSAAFWSETYGGPLVQPLTTASRAYLATHGFLGDRGAIHLADGDGQAALDALQRDFAGPVNLFRMNREALEQQIAGLRRGMDVGLAEPGCRDIDVAGLHAHYLAKARRGGARLIVDAPVRSLRYSDGLWTLLTPAGEVSAPTVVNAAGAWARDLAAVAGITPIGITPYRRTMVQLRVDPPAPAAMPLVIDALGRFYFKPEAGGRIWLSPHDEIATPPCDAAPEELDVAIAIDRLERVVDWQVVSRERAWAGLRSFAPDRAPVYGFDSQATGFFWFAGQGGFGIQTAPAAAMIGAALLLGSSLPDAVRSIDVDRYAPGRFV